MATLLRWGLAAVIALTAIGAVALEPKKVRIAVDQWPPYQSKDDLHFGGAHRVITEALRLEGLEVEYGWFPWIRSLMLARVGDWDAAALSQRTPERERDFYFSEPIVTVNKVFFHLARESFDWQEYSDLAGLHIGLTRANYYGPQFQAAMEAGVFHVDYTVSQFEHNFKKLLAGRIRLFPAEREAAYNYLKINYPYQYQLITYHPRPLQTVAYHVIFSKAIEGNEQLVKTFNRGLKRLQDSGKAQQYLQEGLSGKYVRVKMPK